MKKFTCVIGLLMLALSGCAPKVRPLLHGHAHNDYEHSRPLFEALENGFISVEADVHLIDGKLYVAHERPQITNENRTLEALYLDPLRERIRTSGGRVYRGYDDFFYLMIDIKTSAELSYPVLRNVLRGYTEIISVVSDSLDEKHKPVKIFITGFEGRPVMQLSCDTVKYAGLDGRPEELGAGFPVSLMPVISQNYNYYLHWNGEGNPNPQEVYKLRRMIEAAHAEGKKVRLWAAPEHPGVWRFLLKLGVDLLNTDKLEELKKFAQAAGY